MQWWHWLAGGLLLLVLELVTPSGFFLMFFGLGALTVGVLMLAGLVSDAPTEWLLFTLFSLMYLGLFRKRVQARLEQPPKAVDTLIDDLAVPRERIEPGGVGKAEVRGSIWTARNEGLVALEQGQRCRVVRVTGLELGIKAE